MRIALKLPLLIVAVGLAVGASLGVAAYFAAASSLETEVDAKLAVALQGRKANLQYLFAGIEQDLRLVANSITTRWALHGFDVGWNELGDRRMERLQQLYIHDNPHLPGQRDGLDQGSDNSTYGDVHALYHPWFRRLLQERGYADAFLLKLQGDLIYSVAKEIDFATNVVSGPWSGTDLGRAFRAVRDNPGVGFQSFFDFSAYEPSHGAPASFIATAVLGADGAPIGVLVLRMPITRLNAILQAREGLGVTGETYLVGRDLLMRSNSRFASVSTVLWRKVDNAAVVEALAGYTGMIKGVDSNGDAIEIAYVPVEFNGVRWALLAQISAAEIMAPVVKLAWRIGLISLAVLIMLVVLGWYLGHGIARPIHELASTVDRLASGQLEIEIPDSNRGDEIGRVARAMTAFKQSLIRNRDLEEQRKRFTNELERVALYNSLTGLGNRTLLRHTLDRLSAADDGANATAILLLDLDRFKEVNDTLGHDAGDLLLTSVADRLRELVRSTDCLCRLGGDEFVVVLHPTGTLPSIKHVADQILLALRTPFDLDGQRVNIGTSIGIAISPENGTDVGELIRYADLALYEAKDRGRNTYRFFEEWMSDSVHRRQYLEQTLREAIEDDALMLFFQPQIELRTGKIIGAEALLRWPQQDQAWIPSQ